MRILRLSAGSGLILLALVGLGWFSAPWWLASLASYEISRQGYEPLAVSIGSVGLKQSTIAHLRLRQASSGLEISADHFTLSYQLPALIGGHVDAMQLQNLDISVPAAGPGAAGGNELLSPAALFAAMPAGRIEIGHIALHWLDAGGRVVQSFTGQAGYSDDAMHLQLGEEGPGGLRVDTTLDEAGHCSLHLAQAGKQVAVASCSIGSEGDPARVQGKLDVDLQALDGLLGRWVTLPSHDVSGHFRADWTALVPSQWNADWQRETGFSASFDLAADMQAKSVSSHAAVKGKLSLVDGKGAWRIADDSALVLNGVHVGLAGVRGTFSTGGTPLLSLDEGGSLDVREVDMHALRARRIDLMLVKPVTLDISAAAWRLAQPALISLRTDGLSLDGNKLAFNQLLVHLKAGSLAAPDGSLSLAGFSVGTGKTRWPESDVNGDFAVTGHALTASGKMSVTGGPARLDWRLQQDISAGSGWLDYTMVPLQFPAASPLLAQLAGQAGKLDVQAGSMTGQGRLQWGGKQSLSGRLHLVLRELQGRYRENRFAGVGGDVDVGVGRRGLDFTSAKLTARSIDTGLLLSNVGMKARLIVPFGGKPRVRLSGVHAEALGGAIDSDAIDIDMGRKSNPFVVRLAHIDVKRLVDFRKQEGLSADGLLDGTLPFDWTDKGLTMTTGKLDARTPGGLIRYTGSASVQHFAASDQAAGLAMQLLNDFHYRELNMRADYRPDGEMDLHIALKGHNPGYDKGRPINFNLNIQENVLKLLESLRIADEISRQVEQKVQKSLQNR